jgi:hypothetical protein
MEHDKFSELLPDDVDRGECDELDSTWRMLRDIPAPTPDSARMRARLDAVISTVEETQAAASHDDVSHRREKGLARRSFNRYELARRSFSGRGLARRSFSGGGYVLQGLAAAAMLFVGIAIGRFGAPERATGTTSSPEIEAMRGEMRELREMVSLSLMQQQSASERLKGVTWTGQLDRPSGEVVSALLDALMHDPNVNVRLATVDALERFAAREDVRHGAIEAVNRQMSPLVQIALIDFMVKTNERESVATLRQLAQDPQVNDTVRARAAWGLQQLG